MARPRRVDRESLVQAALDIADGEGLPAVTMQRLATQLDVTAMALYRHVGHKDELLDHMVQALLVEIGIADAERSWGDRLGDLLDRVRAVARRHPGSFPLLLQRPVVGAEAVRVRDQMYVALSDAGIGPGDLATVERIVSTLALGFAASEAAGRFGDPGPSLDGHYVTLDRFVRAGLEALRTPSDLVSDLASDQASDPSAAQS